MKILYEDDWYDVPELLRVFAVLCGGAALVGILIGAALGAVCLMEDLWPAICAGR